MVKISRWHGIFENVHKRSLRAIYKSYNADYEALLEFDNSLSIHSKHLIALLCEIYKSFKSENPTFTADIF